MGYFRNFAISQVKVKRSLTCSFQILQLTIVNGRPQSIEARVSELRTKNRPIFIIIKFYSTSGNVVKDEDEDNFDEEDPLEADLPPLTPILLPLEVL